MKNFISQRKLLLGALALVGVGIAIGLYLADTKVDLSLVRNAQAQEAAEKEKPGASPTEPRERDFYAPNSEALGPDEMRLIACGTGMPTARPKQAATCFLLELGNGDKFLFDIGTGSAERISALQIPYNYLDKVFLSHLHSDHFGDMDALYIGGALMGRQKPLRVWGPSGDTPERGTAYALDHLQKALTWDLDGRKGITDPRGYVPMEVTEFDYKGVNEIVYQENGVTIRSIPAIHSLDGPVSYILEWNDFKFVFGGDTYPNDWFAEHAGDADLVIHECFITVPALVEKFKFTPQGALDVGTQVHTAPEAFGKMMAMIEPRMAVAFHFFNDFDTAPDIERRIRTTYEGPVSLAVDYMVWNITRDEIRTRMAVFDEDVWPPQPTEKPQVPDPTLRIPFSDFISNGKSDMKDVIQPIYDEVNEEYGLEETQGD